MRPRAPLLLAGLAIALLAACETRSERQQALEHKYRRLGLACLKDRVRLSDAHACLAARGAGTRIEHHLVLECEGGGWFEGPRICAGLQMTLEPPYPPEQAVVVSWRAISEVRSPQGGLIPR